MNINLTIVVQALNFFLAYMVMKKLLLKPAVEEIELDDQVRVSIDEAIRSHEISISTKEQEISKQWATCQRHFALYTPFLDDLRYVPRVKEDLIIEVMPLSKDRMQELTHKVANIIVEDVCNVRY